MQEIARLEKDVALIVAPATGKNLTQAAAEAGVDQSTVHRKLAKPNFRRKVARLRQQYMSAALGRIADGMSEASGKLLDLLHDPSPHVRLRAARTLLYMGVKLRESIETGDRLDDIERALARAKEGTP